MRRNGTQKRNQFTQLEDMKLKSLVNTFGEKNWETISQHMQNRTARQCRDRYKYYLAPFINSEPWTYEEELKLEVLVSVFGKKWCIIRRYFNGRTEINLRCHYSLLERRKEKVENIVPVKSKKGDSVPSEPEHIEFESSSFDEFESFFD